MAVGGGRGPAREAGREGGFVGLEAGMVGERGGAHVRAYRRLL